MNEESFTKIPNELMEVLMSPALNSSHMGILVYIARKTYGYHKKSDQISLSQFQNKLKLGRKYVNLYLKDLRLVSLVKLVKKGKSRLSSNEYLIDTEEYPTKLVSLMELVSKRAQTTSFRGVPKTKHTKESITKEKKTHFLRGNAENKESAVLPDIDIAFKIANQLRRPQ